MWKDAFIVPQEQEIVTYGLRSKQKSVICLIYIHYLTFLLIFAFMEFNQFINDSEKSMKNEKMTNQTNGILIIDAIPIGNK